MGHFETVCRSKWAEGNTIEQDEETIDEVGAFGEFFALEKLEVQANKLFRSERGTTKLNHHAWNAFSGWKPAKGEAHPKVKISMEV